jgi:hypothetical protein
MAKKLSRKELLRLKEIVPPAWLHVVGGLVFIGAIYDVFSTRTLADILTYSVRSAVGVFSVSVLLIVIVCWLERPKPTFGSLLGGFLGLAIFAPMCGLFAYVIGASIKDAFLWTQIGISELNRPVTWLSTRALVAGALLPLILGVVLFFLRLKVRSIYGATEVLAGAVVAMFKYVDNKGNEDVTAPGFAIAMLTASVYLVVRGLDNFHQGMQDPKDLFVAMAPWLHNRRLNLKLSGLRDEIHSRARIPPDPDIVPLTEIKRRVTAAPDAPESKTLGMIIDAIEQRTDAFDENKVWTLGPEELGLLDALIEERLNGYI